MAPLTPAQLAELTANLQALERTLAVQLGLATDSAKTVELDEPIGRVSRIDALQQQQMAHAARRRSGSRLQQVRAALGRIDDEEYGDCLACDEPIGYGRLKARPETPNCVTCQASFERR